MNKYYYDYIVAGAGLAGIYIAHIASRYGRVALLSKSEIGNSNSFLAQGGIAAVTSKDDSAQLHFEDTIVAGRGLCDYNSVEILVNEAPERIKELMCEGMEFDCKDGVLSLGLEGGHHRNRILHAGGDATGKIVSSFLTEKVQNNDNIDIYQNHTVTNILKHNDICIGVSAIEIGNGIENVFLASHTIISTGGAAAIYNRTTNPSTTTGDGIALCYEAGCQIADMEFIQFHPSAIYSTTDDTFLISEAVRGEGAYLYNKSGERFMVDIHELAELAPRDIVARSIFEQMKNSGDDYVYLSLSHLDADMIKRRFPTIFEHCSNVGIDMTDKIPIAPAAHYTVGGVKVDINGATSVPNLYACGEVASTGIMGANRLASNSLIECLVFGKRLIENIKYTKFTTIKEYNYSKTEYDVNNANHFLKIKEELLLLMSGCAGIVRNGNDMQMALERVKLMKERININEKEFFMLSSHRILTVAELILSSAIHRKESRGGHFRTDYPETNKEWETHTTLIKNGEISNIPVNKG